MKLPISWLRSHVDVALEVDELVDLMTQHGLEVEDVAFPGAGTEGVSTARVIAHRPHPDADKLRIVEVTSAEGTGSVEVVCGASNFDAGDIVVHAPPGSHIPGMQLEARELRGVVSHGMLCSPRELGLGEDHSGLLILDHQTPPGASFTEIVALGEPVIEIAVQADRGDHLGILGVARDLSAILEVAWRDLDVPQPSGDPVLDVTLATDDCASFVTWALDEVSVVDSPVWMRQRLLQCGVRPIDLVVDVTNYVMLETGQPLHAFDLDTIRGGRLNVRPAADGEELVTLDAATRRLEAGDLVIEDGERIVSLAGVMGGLDTEVTATTRRVLIEAAIWNPAAIRRTSRRLGLVSEASTRFERRVDPQGASRAAARAAGLLAELAGARIVGVGSTVQPEPPQWVAPVEISVRPAGIRQLLGVDELDRARQTALLERAGCEVTDGSASGPETDETLRVRPPSWRGDLRRQADLAEEIARLHGYDRIPASVPPVRSVGGRSPSQRALQQVREAVLAYGFDESVSRPFVGDDTMTGLVPSDGRVLLANPLAKDAAAMRPSLVDGLLTAVRRNVGQGRPGVSLAEIGRIFRPVEDPLAEVLDGLQQAGDGGSWRWTDPNGGALPCQPRVLGLVAQGVPVGPGWLDLDSTHGVFDLLATFDAVMRTLCGDAQRRTLSRHPVERAGFHPGRAAILRWADHEVGFVGQLHPTQAAQRDLPEPVVVGELLLEPWLAALAERSPEPVRARPIVRHPAMTIDVAFVADVAVPFSRMAELLASAAGELLDDWWFFDEYRGEQVGDGNRSVAVRLRLQHPERQLTDADSDAVISAIEEAAVMAGMRLRR